MCTWARAPRPKARAAFLALPIALLLLVCLSVPAFAAGPLVVDNSAGCVDAPGSAKYCTIQAAIDAAVAGDTIKVYPGNYSETAANRMVLGTNGPHQFGLFIDKNNLTIQGVDASGNPITNYANVAAYVTTNSTANFGPDGILVQGDGVTISGLHIGPNYDAPNHLSQNKTFEIIGDGFALKYSHIDVPANATTSERGAIYFGDWRFNVSGDQSYIKSYTIEGNWFDHAASLTLVNGAGYSGPVSGRVIKNNKFSAESGYPWAVITFTGKGSPVPWYVYGVGGAQITGNQFLGGQQYILARATYDNSQFNWKSYWEDNTYERAAVALANPATFDVRAYTYTSGSYTYDNTRRIGALIQPQIDVAQPGDTVLVKAGTYDEHLTINKFVKLVGAGSGSDPATNSVIHTTTANDTAHPVLIVSGSGASDSNPLLLQNLRVEPTGGYGIDLRNTQFVRLENVKVVGSPTQFTENERCLDVDTAYSVSNLTIVNSAFTDCDHGWFSFKDKTETNGTFIRNVYVANTSFANNGYKGIYLEKLSDAVFENVSVTNNGSSPYWNGATNAGIDINLKGHEQYKNLLFKNLIVTGNGLGYEEGTGVMIKARDDSPNYNGPTNGPATLDNVVIEGGVFSGNERGIRFGEPGKNNAGPTNVTIHNAAIYGNVKHYAGTGSIYGGVVNQTQSIVDATNNWWGATNGPSGKGAGSGDAVDWTNAVVLFNPWLTNATLVIPNDPIHLRSDATSFQLPVKLSPGSGPFSSVAFSVDYDQACLSINPADANNDGIPEAIAGMPIGFVNSVMLNTADTNGELDVAIWDVTPPLASLPAGPLLTITFDINPACRPSDSTTFVKFSSTPGVSFADLLGAAAFGTTQSANPLLLDFNQAPTDLTLSGNTVAENQPAGTTVGAFSNTDPDSFNTFTYSFDTTCANGGADNGAFTISGNVLKTNAVFDYETKASYAICVKVDDGWGGSLAKPFTVNVTNTAEPATNITLSPSAVEEGKPVGTVVGAFTASGGDPAATYTYSLVSGDGSADNAKFTISGNQLLTNAVFNYSQQSTFYIRVRATNGAAIFEKQLVVTVLGHSKLGIGDDFVVRNGQSVAVPVVFTANGNAPTGGSFSLTYNASCLAFTGMTGGAGSATTPGTLNVSSISGPFVDGQPAVTLNFTAAANCPNGTTVPLHFTAAALTNASGNLPVTTDDGKVLVIANSARGDCNTDGFVNAGDFSAIVLETFDSDGTFWLNAPQSTFHGSPAGCDANASTYIDVADVVCTVLVVFGNNSCTTGSMLAAAEAPAATLAVNPTADGQSVSVPVSLASGGQNIAGANFTLTYDPAQAALDTADADNDGLPDAVTFNLPADLKRSVSVDAAAGTVKIAVYGLKLPLPVIADGALVTIRLQAKGAQAAASINVIDMALGNDGGQNVPVSLSLNGQAGRSLYLPALSK